MLPVTATAAVGIVVPLVTCQLRAVFALNAPDRPVPTRVSRTRTAAIGLYVVPLVWRRVIRVRQPAAPAEYSLPFQAWFGTCGSWATPT